MTDIFKQRSQKVLGQLQRQGVDALILFPSVEMFYLTGMSVGLTERPFAAIVPVNGEPVWYIPRLEQGLRGRKTWITAAETWSHYPFENLAELLKRRGLANATLGVCERTPWGWIASLQALLTGARFVDATPAVDSVRMVKADDELAAMRRSCDIVDKSVTKGFANLREGMTEKELADIIRGEMIAQGADIDFCIALFGERAAMPHGGPGDRTLRTGDVVLVDAGNYWQLYLSDITRTVVFGQPTERQQHIWNTVLAANLAAQAAAKPGVLCEDLDAVARKVIDDAGMGEYFIHRLGHGIGLQGHEQPYLDKGSRIALEPGMTFTIEPGIYIPGELGVRIENTVLCTQTAAEPLTKMPITIQP